MDKEKLIRSILFIVVASVAFIMAFAINDEYSGYYNDYSASIVRGTEITKHGFALVLFLIGLILLAIGGTSIFFCKRPSAQDCDK